MLPVVDPIPVVVHPSADHKDWGKGLPNMAFGVVGGMPPVVPKACPWVATELTADPTVCGVHWEEGDSSVIQAKAMAQELQDWDIRRSLQTLLGGARHQSLLLRVTSLEEGMGCHCTGYWGISGSFLASVLVVPTLVVVRSGMDCQLHRWV